MSGWAIGPDPLKEEIASLKRQIANQDIKCSHFESRLLKTTTQLEEMKDTLSEAQTNLRREADRAEHLEKQLLQTKEDLENQRLSRQNVEDALRIANEKTKSQEVAAREMQNTIQTLSSKESGSSTAFSSLQKEKERLEGRVRLLEANYQNVVSAATPGRPGRPRSSSLSDMRLTTLERELRETHAALNDCRSNLEKSQEKLRQVEDNLVRADNEKVAVERRMKSELTMMKAQLDEKDEDIEQLQAQSGGDGLGQEREEELIRRIEEEEAKVSALETLVRGTKDMKKMQDALDRAEKRLKAEMEKVKKGDEVKHDLTRTRDRAVKDLRDAQSQIQGLTRALEERDRRIVFLDGQERELRSQVEQAREQIASLEQVGQPGSTTFDKGLLNNDEGFTALAHSTPTSSTDGSLPPPVYQPRSPQDLPSEEEVARLFATIARLRSERDGLRRDLEYLELESRFTTEGLQSKLDSITATLDASTSGPGITNQQDLVQQLTNDVQRLQEQLAQTMSRDDTTRKTADGHVALVATSSLVMVSHLQSRAEQDQGTLVSMNLELRQLRSELGARLVRDEESARTIAGLQHNLHQARTSRDACVQDLKQATAYQDDLLARIARHEDLVEELRKEKDQVCTELDEVNAAFQQAEAELTQVTQTLEDIASDHDSLALHVTNLEADLEQAQEDIAEGERRYSALQVQQLSAMSSSEVALALRQQIEELEGRVARRTEQIGLHQHDIKRLEINNQLNEERIAEMGSELDTAITEKESMLQDCAEAREARDQALRRVEELEEEVETLDARIEESEERVREADDRVRTAEERAQEADRRITAAEQTMRTAENQRTVEAATLVGLWADAISRSRASLSRPNAAIPTNNSTEQDLAAHLEQVTSHANVTASRLDDALLSLRTANETVDRNTNEGHETTVALAVSQLELRSRVQCLNFQRTRYSLLEGQVEQVRQELGLRLNEIATLHEQLGYAQQAKHATPFTPSTDLELRLQHLQQQNDELQAEKARLRDLFDRSQEELRGLNDDIAFRAQNVQTLEQELATLRNESMAEVAQVQAQLTDATQKLSSVETSHQASWDQLSRAYQELDERYKHCLELSEADKQRAFDAEAAQTAQEEEMLALQTRLDERLQELEQLGRDREEEEEHHRQTIDTLTRTKDDLEAQLATVRGARDDILPELERLREQIASRASDIEHLQAKLTAELAAHDADRESFESQRRLSSEQYGNLEQSVKATRRDLETVHAQLEEANLACEELQNEKAVLEHRVTELEAEIQRGLSMRRHLESQLAESSREVAGLKTDFEHVKGGRFQAVQAEKSAQIELTLQRSRYEQTIASLRRQIDALKPNVQHEEMIADLQDELQRTDDMLRAKTQEIEENDDRFLELMKEKKKMSTKIESLSRKVQTLQSKLASAKETALAFTAAPPAPVASSSRSPSMAAPSPSQGSAKPTIPPKFIAVLNGAGHTRLSTSPQSHSRAVSGPSSSSGPTSMPRPRTPDRNMAAPAVFKLKTPEHIRQPVESPPSGPLPPPPSTTLIGKKRSAPDDNYDSARAQGFTADGAPFNPDRDRSDLTPRVRKQTRIGAGFTPVRNIMARTMGSPQVRDTELAMPADVTNSPGRASSSRLDSKAVAKKGWLGKMRGGSSTAAQNHSRQAGGHGTSRANVFERPRGP